MMIEETFTYTTHREVHCLVVDYNRLLPNGWPLLTPVGDYMPRATNRNAVNYIDRVKVLKMISEGMAQIRIAERLGCGRKVISAIKTEAAEAAKEALQ